MNRSVIEKLTKIHFNWLPIYFNNDWLIDDCCLIIDSLISIFSNWFAFNFDMLMQVHDSEIFSSNVQVSSDQSDQSQLDRNCTKKGQSWTCACRFPRDDPRVFVSSSSRHECRMRRFKETLDGAFPQPALCHLEIASSLEH